MTMRISFTHSKRQQGLSLVELMVSLVIGLVATLVLMQVFSFAEDRRRSTGGVVGAQNAGSLAMLSLDHDLRQAGYGLSSTRERPEPLFNCLAKGVNTDVVANPDFTLRLRPVSIADGIGAAPDEISTLHGNSMFRVTGVKVENSTTTTKVLKSAAGFRKGDRFIVTGTDTNTASEACGLFEATSIAGTTITHLSATNYTINDDDIDSSNDQVVKSSNNPTNNYGISFATIGTEAFNIGPLPSSRTYKVDANHRLVLTAGISAAGETVLAEDVMDLQAQYGIDKNNNRKIDDDNNEWTSTSPTNDADWKNVRAIRWAILVRSQDLHKDKLTTIPAWAGGNFLMKNLDGSSGSGDIDGDINNWRYYRYRVFEATVPLRNVIWGVDYE